MLFRISTERLANFSAVAGIEEWKKGGKSLGTVSLYLPEMLLEKEHPASY